jgi:hypothetical protein
VRLLPAFLLAALVVGCARTLTPVNAPVRLCIVDSGELKEVLGSYSAATGDTMVNGRRFSEAHTGAYAAGLPWFESNEPLAASSPRASYVKYGVPLIFAPGQLRRAGERHGVPVFVETSFGDLPPAVIYVPVCPGCWFHPYQLVGVGEVRT